MDPLRNTPEMVTSQKERDFDGRSCRINSQFEERESSGADCERLRLRNQ